MSESDPVWALLQKSQAQDLPCPEVLLEADGDLGFDWLDHDRILSVSLSPSGHITWAALVGDYKASGWFQWPDWSPELDKAFRMFNE